MGGGQLNMTLRNNARLMQYLVFACIAAGAVILLRLLVAHAFRLSLVLAVMLVLVITLQAIGSLVEALWRLSGTISLRSQTPSITKGDEPVCPPVTS